MKYTGRIVGVFFPILFNVIYIFVRDGSVSFSYERLLSILLNVVVGYFFGLAYDKYRYSKNVSLKQFEYALRSTTDGVAIFNRNGELQYCNEAYLHNLRFKYEEIVKKPWSVGYQMDEITLVEEKVLESLKSNGNWKGELIGVRKDRTTFPQEVTISTIKETGGFVTVSRDITEKKNTESYIKQLANHNELTNLPNRRMLIKHVKKYVEAEQHFAILFMDLDRFKMTNDTLGHAAGDELLLQVAKRLLSFKSDTVSIYHFGGDEFLLLVQDDSKETVKDFANEVIEKINEKYVIDGYEIFITASIGISFYPENSDNPEELISIADTAMYYAKLKGKNNYQLYTVTLKEKLERKMLMETELRNAILHNELSLHYQPKFNLCENELIGMEALLRWENAMFGKIPPTEFIPLAEETGLIHSIGDWVILQALEQMWEWKRKGYNRMKVSVNLSLVQLRQLDFGKKLAKAIEAYDVDPKLFELEITESVMENVEEILPTLEEIRSIGVGISIDDFGTGFSSLSYLKSLPIDTIKIDRSFILDLIHNKDDEAIVKSILDIGNNLNLSVVAEGIETEEHLHILNELGCPIGQGYYFSKPLSAIELEEKFLK